MYSLKRKYLCKYLIFLRRESRNLSQTSSATSTADKTLETAVENADASKLLLYKYNPILETETRTKTGKTKIKRVNLVLKSMFRLFPRCKDLKLVTT